MINPSYEKQLSKRDDYTDEVARLQNMVSSERIRQESESSGRQFAD